MRIELLPMLAAITIFSTGCGEQGKGQLPSTDITGLAETIRQDGYLDAVRKTDDGKCQPQCAERECGDDGCDGECGKCELGSSCAQGECVQIACEGGPASLDGEFSNSLSPVLFDSVSVEVFHKRDVDEWEDGCISAVTMVFKKGPGCTLTVHAEESFNLDGLLVIQNLTFEADSQCPGFPDGVEGVYSDLSNMKIAGVELGVTDVPGNDVPESCLNTTLKVHLEGILAEAGGDKELQVLPTQLVVDGDFLSTGDYTQTCPCQPSCADKECGDAGCGISCGGCACGETCITGTCAFSACDGKECGTDGCGGDCGECSEFPGSVCSVDQQCECEAECAGKVCGDDGCGGECGSCECGESCVQGACKSGTCTGKECGDDGCGGSCGTCTGMQQGCVAGQCQCVPDCDGKACGPDGCGGNCGVCDTYCVEGSYECCEPDCEGKGCGNDGCSGNCGTCGCGNKCVGGECQFEACLGLECGSDGCGGSCGSCLGQDECIGGHCECQPGCIDKECGDDGCNGSCGACGGVQEACEQGSCVCQPACLLAECGENGCGSVCGVCNESDKCVQGQCLEVPYLLWSKIVGTVSNESLTGAVANPIGGMLVTGYAYGAGLKGCKPTLSGNGSFSATVSDAGICSSAASVVGLSPSGGMTSDMTLGKDGPYYVGSNHLSISKGSWGTALAPDSQAWASFDAIHFVGSGGAIAAGSFKDANLTLGSIALQNNGEGDVIIARVNQQLEVVWAFSFGGPSQDDAYAVSADSQGNFTVGGYCYSSNVELNTTPPMAIDSPGGFVVKLEEDGTPLWSSKLGKKHPPIRALATLSSGSVVAVGHAGISIFAVLLGSDGMVVWSKEFVAPNDQSGKGNSYAWSVAVDSLDNVYIAGTVKSPEMDFGGGPLGKSGVYFAKFSPGGQHIWSRAFGNSNWDKATAVVVDDSDVVYLAGEFTSSSISFGGAAHANNGGEGCGLGWNCPDIFVAAFGQ